MRHACVSISVSSVKKTHLTIEMLSSTLTRTLKDSQDPPHYVSMKYSHRMAFKCTILYKYPRMLSNGLGIVPRWKKRRNPGRPRETRLLAQELCHRPRSLSSMQQKSGSRNVHIFGRAQSRFWGAHRVLSRADLTCLDSPFRTPRIAPRFDFISNF